MSAVSAVGTYWQPLTLQALDRHATAQPNRARRAARAAQGGHSATQDHNFPPRRQGIFRSHVRQNASRSSPASSVTLRAQRAGHRAGSELVIAPCCPHRPSAPPLAPRGAPQRAPWRRARASLQRRRKSKVPAAAAHATTRGVRRGPPRWQRPAAGGYAARARGPRGCARARSRPLWRVALRGWLRSVRTHRDARRWLRV